MNRFPTPAELGQEAMAALASSTETAEEHIARLQRLGWINSRGEVTHLLGGDAEPDCMVPEEAFDPDCAAKLKPIAEGANGRPLANGYSGRFPTPAELGREAQEALAANPETTEEHIARLQSMGWINSKGEVTRLLGGEAEPDCMEPQEADESGASPDANGNRNGR